MLNNTSKPDVLTMALFSAAAAHAIVILGVSFEPILQDLRTPPSLEVVLVQKSDSERPEEADYLAQSAQDGGGESDENDRPAAPFVSEQDFNTDGVAPTPIEASSPAPTEAAAEAVLTNVFSEVEVQSENEQIETELDAKLDNNLEVEQNFEIARLEAEIDRLQEKTAKRPKKKYLNARTHEAVAAEYMYRWVEKVERIGNLNYPDAVRRNRLSGAVVMTVGIFKNGSVESIQVDESSGQRIIDDAAKRFVQLASPFEPLVGPLGEETDILYITRTWEFQSSNSITSY